MTESKSPPSLSVVIPVYQGEFTLHTVVKEILEEFDGGSTCGIQLLEVVLVHDGAVDASADELLELAQADDRVKPVWLSRNYGQHAATLAGCASTVGDWIVTMDEDGLHDPKAIGEMVTTAEREGVDLVYAHPKEHTHAHWRVVTSNGAKHVARALFGVDGAQNFSSFRLLDGYATRALAAYCGHGVYLDVALQWVLSGSARIETGFRTEGRPSSGYSLGSLLSHFRRMILTAGPRPLRVASLFGLAVAFMGIVGAGVLIIGRVSGQIEVPGWTSVMVALSVFAGIILLVLGLIAEYLTMVLSAVSGRPPYLITGRPPRRPNGE